VNCVYYELKASIFVKVDDLFLSGRSQLSVSLVKSEAPCDKPQGILNNKEGDCIPLTPAPQNTTPLMAWYSAGVS
jgi:hypothetical protein